MVVAVVVVEVLATLELMNTCIDREVVDIFEFQSEL